MKMAGHKRVDRMNRDESRRRMPLPDPVGAAQKELRHRLLAVFCFYRRRDPTRIASILRVAGALSDQKTRVRWIVRNGTTTEVH